MKFRYLTPLTYPSRYANRLQVMKMSEAFSHIFVSFKLYVREIRADLKQVFGEYGIKRPFMMVELGSPKGFLKSFWLARRVRIYIEQEPDAVWFLRDVLLAYWLIWLGYLRRKSFFFEVHTLGRFPYFMLRKIFRRADGIIVTNKEKAREISRRFLLDSEKIMVAPNGADTEFLSILPDQKEAREKLGLPQDKKIILRIARPAPQRGTETMLDAAPMLPQNTIFVSLGGNDDEINQWRSYPNFEKIIWVSHVPYERVRDYIAAADILAAPFSGQEAHFVSYMSPLKIMESLASGKPSILSDLPSLREIASEEEVFFFRPDDANDFAKKITYALSNPKIMQALAKRAKKKAELFSWKARAANIKNFIDERLRWRSFR